MKNKRHKILEAAEKIMSAKGRKASISEISEKAGVTDSVLYHYFKNKEDLLFSVAHERLNDALVKMEEQLQGIVDPMSQLSKLIWFQLYYHDTHQDFANLLLFECRSSDRFMRHEAYRTIKRWADIGVQILVRGIAGGTFRSDLSLPVARDAIFGLADMQNIQSMVTHFPDQAHTELDAILDLVQPMICADRQAQPPQRDKADRIIEAAIGILATKGYQKATIQEISKAAEVSDGTIYEYFKNKEDLLFSTLERQFDQNLDSLDEVFQIRSPLRKLRRFIRYHFTIYLKNPVFTKVFLFDAIYNYRFYASRAYQPFKNYLESIYDILEEGKRDGSIRPEINNRIFVNLFMGIFSHMVTRWLFTEKANHAGNVVELNAAVDLLCRAVKLVK